MAKRTPGLLITESAKAFARQHKGLAAQIRPTGAVETEYVKDSAYANLEIDRYRRIAAALLNARMEQALGNLLKRLLPEEEYDTHLALQHAAEDFARRYFSESEVRAYALELLRSVRLDETAIEAEAFRLCAAELEVLNRMIATLTGHRDKDYFMLAELRKSGLWQAPAVEPEVPQLVARVKRAS
jgi:hypothetical protein